MTSNRYASVRYTNSTTQSVDKGVIDECDETILSCAQEETSQRETSLLSIAVFRLFPPLEVDLRLRLPVVAPALDRFFPRVDLGVAVPSSASFVESCGPDCVGPE
jgi:hypothetical protein